MAAADATTGPVMDIYMRMSEDHEKDYCFRVPANAPVKSLFNIFDTLPMVLSPSYFYNVRPMGFAVSREPGFLTADGGLLFNDNADKDKFLRKLDPEALIKTVAWEGQLFVPLWEFNYSRYTTLLSVLFGWLYLDLPDHISPTPGHQPSTLLLALVEHYFPNLKDDSPSPFDGLGWQYGFFAFHVVKVLFIFAIFWVGGVNPHSMNPIENKKAIKDVTREQLLSIGWTSSRRATVHEWHEEYRKLKIEAAGGIVKAYHEGILDKMRGAGVKLGKGEGWDSPSPSDPRAKPEEGKFIVSEEYFKLAYAPLVTIIEDEKLDEANKSTAIKTFRRIGPTNSPPALVELYEKRKAVEPEKKKK